VLRDYLEIVKPGIIAGNIVSMAGGFFLASRGRVYLPGLAAALGGMCFVVASGCVFNNCLDRDLDRTMKRTRNRVLARGGLPVEVCVLYATFLGLAGFGLLGLAVNFLTLAAALAGFTIYVGIYSLYLKRASVCATLVGSLAGAVPPLAGYFAAANRLDTGALILFAIFILWQIPHYYSIAVFRFDDYCAAQIPILPVKRGIAVAKKHIAGYITAFIVASSMLTLCGYTGLYYLAVTTLSGLAWLFVSFRGCKGRDERFWAGRLYFFSILTMLVLSLMMSIDFKGAG
jgi:protoheme IX farnesyltransferase